MDGCDLAVMHGSHSYDQKQQQLVNTQLTVNVLNVRNNVRQWTRPLHLGKVWPRGTMMM